MSVLKIPDNPPLEKSTGYKFFLRMTLTLFSEKVAISHLILKINDSALWASRSQRLTNYL